MKLAIIAPIPHLRQFACQSDIHLVLAHWVVEHPETYGAFYRNRIEMGDYVILDNGAYEFGASSALELIAGAADILKNPSEIVLPDVLNNGAETLEASTRAYSTLRRVYPNSNLMVIPQGSDWIEWEWCLGQLYGFMPSIDCIGIPRRQADAMKTWVPHIHAINRQFGDHVPIHLFGCPDTLTAAREVEHYFPDRVRSTDSAKMLHFAMNDTAFASPLDPRQVGPKRPTDFITNRLCMRKLLVAQNNINVYKQSINAGA